MRRHETSTPRVAFGAAAVAMSAITLGVMVFMPARMRSDRREPRILATANAVPSAPAELITTAGIAGLGNAREPLLERQRDALDQVALQRAADQRQAMIGNEGTSESDSDSGTEAYDYAPVYASGVGIVAYSIEHRQPMRHRKPTPHDLRRVAARPPHAVARR
jgi:hypothetical protein